MQKVVLVSKNWIQPVNGMRSTRSLVEIHNNQYHNNHYGAGLHPRIMATTKGMLTPRSRQDYKDRCQINKALNNILSSTYMYSRHQIH